MSHHPRKPPHRHTTSFFIDDDVKRIQPGRQNCLLPNCSPVCDVSTPATTSTSQRIEQHRSCHIIRGSHHIVTRPRSLSNQTNSTWHRRIVSSQIVLQSATSPPPRPYDSHIAKDRARSECRWVSVNVSWKLRETIRDSQCVSWDENPSFLFLQPLTKLRMPLVLSRQVLAIVPCLRCCVFCPMSALLPRHCRRALVSPFLTS